MNIYDRVENVIVTLVIGILVGSLSTIMILK